MNIASNGMGALLPRASNAQQARPQPVLREGQPTDPAHQAQSSANATSASKPFDVNALVENLWGFMQGRLADAKASGASEQDMEKLWQAAEKGLEQGFSEAKGALNALGKMTEPLNDKIDQAYDRLTETLDKRDVNARVPVMQVDAETAKTEARRHISLYQYQERTFELDVTTSQGDRVSIRVMNSSEAAASHQSGDDWSRTRWGKTDANAFQLQIKGDLNEQERADLDQLLGDVNTLANEFYDGDLNLAWKQAQALSIDGTSLASMDLGMRSVEAKGVGAYQQEASSAGKMPKGLDPLRQYANDLIQAQEQWRERLSSDQGLLAALDNHPRNEGSLGHLARQLLS